VGGIAFQDRKNFLLRRNRKSLGVLNMEEYGTVIVSVPFSDPLTTPVS
jgi:hypothetical protein